MTGVVVVVAVLMAATAVGVWRRRRDGRLRAAPAAATGRPALDTLGVRPGEVTLVQFSAPVCAPCRATRRVLEQVTGDVPGVRLLEVDAERHLDAVRALDVWRTPTVLLVDGAGRVVRRAAGVPTRDELTAALRPLLARAGR
ncbi:Thiol-disulfide isomerase or thioredoxin [Micromonospora halophytica]|uniref:Thiol-disulfide isomerase or thioredoxin n=2 Tax=Micromonospora halophytica TaxID=47864 RepID=A0A1C5HJM6_9ACTN|nr:Thiol-disulfide isomerase or thioredoxin [Micromonospora halophytica]